MIVQIFLLHDATFIDCLVLLLHFIHPIKFLTVYCHFIKLRVSLCSTKETEFYYVNIEFKLHAAVWFQS